MTDDDLTVRTSTSELKRSGEYSKLLEELKQAFVSAADVAVKLYEQGRKDGLSNEAIRKDIETTFDGIVKERRLREILPTKLKQSYTHVLTFDSALRKADVGSNKLQRYKIKSNNVLTPQQSVALIGSIIIIVMAFGGLGLVYNVFAQSQNQNLTSTYENKEHDFTFNYPATWHNELDANEARLNNYVVALADPFSNDTDGIERVIFRVNVSDVHKSLDSDLQIRSDTPEDYIRNTIDYVNESQYQTNAAIKEATSYEETDKPLWTLENLKNNTIKISGENASRVHYVESYEGEQKVFTIFIFVVKDDKVYELNFYTSEPLKVPETLPIAEKIIQSFRFI